MNSINFTANYLRTVYIQKKSTDNSYKTAEASIVELDTNDKKDIDALGETAYEWDKITSNYAYSIYSEALKKKLTPDTIAKHYLALTVQNSDYENLNPDKILGLAIVSETNEPYDELNWLQVSPNTNSKNSTDRTYKNIGSKLVEYTKDISDKPIILFADRSAVDFYKKQDFHPLNSRSELLLICDA